MVLEKWFPHLRVSDSKSRDVGMPWAKIVKGVWDWRGVWMTAPGVAILVVALRFAGVLQPLEWLALDALFQLRPLESQDKRVAIVGITEADINSLGQWPISDAVLAEAIAKLKQHEPAAIGLDLYRNLPVPPGHERLVELFESTPNLIGIEKAVGDDVGEAVAAPTVLQQLNQVGSNDVPQDGDGKIRRAVLFLKTPDGRFLESLGLKLAWLYLAQQGVTPEAAAINSRWMQLGNAVFREFEANDGPYVGADDGGYQILLNFRGGAGSFEIVSLSDLLSGKLPPDWGRDRVVLIGPLAVSLNDFFETPYSFNFISSPQRMTGVEIQANLTSQIISAALDDRPLIRVWPDRYEVAWIVAWCAVGAIASWSLGRIARIVVIVPLLAVGLTAGCFWLFLQGWWIPLAPPLLGLSASTIAIVAYIANQEREDRQLVMNLFGRHVTPQIAEAIWRDRHELLKEGRLMAKKVQATVLFTDIKNFSSLAEESDPETLMLWLNEYMEEMAGLVLAHGGVVDKFIGDSVMAVFGVPIPRSTPEAIAADAVAAVTCAVDMAKKLRSLHRKWHAEGRPIVNMRVGISTGTVVIGSLGSAEREDYTTIGDSVNVAARLESYNKEIDGGICRILIGEETYVHVEGKFPAQYLGSVMLKGRQKPVRIYQVLAD
jgi:adenylate cyclase